MRISQKESLKLHLAARCPLNYVVSWENEVVVRELRRTAENLFENIYVWSITDGMKLLGEDSDEPRLQGPYEALEAICANATKSIYFLHDFHPYINDSRITRKLRDAYRQLQKASSCVVIVAPKSVIPLDLEKEMSIFHFPLPSISEIKKIFLRIEAAVTANKTLDIDLSEDEKNQLIEAGLGLTEKELKNVFAKALVRDRRLDINDIDVVIDEKRQIIEKSGYLEFYSSDENFLNVGGLDNFKSWIKVRSAVLGSAARLKSLPMPKGVLITGVPGTGKSLAAKAISSEWRWPLLRLDVGKLFGGIVGSSEENIRKTITIAEAVAPAVLWVDEIEKGFTGVMSGGDSGASSRVFSTFLTWLQEKKSSIFLVATANNISALPPEFLRKGRFDEIFFVDLPTGEEREEIFKIHLKNHVGASWPQDSLNELVVASDGFTGAEIEQVILSSMYSSLAIDEDLNTGIMLQEIVATFPLSKTMKEDIDKMREWARYRARFASDKIDKPAMEDGERWENL